jgi:two-component system phosphate regulon sensor histidine kinase PhoR
MTRLDIETEFTFSEFDLHALIRELLLELAPIAAQKRHDIRFMGAHDVVSIRADRKYLARALRDIITNALNYTPDGGLIALETKRNEQHITVCVQDNGIGIRQEDIPRIFERFYRVDQARNMQQGGTGLGLALAKKIVEGHSGRIEVESELDKGSTFSIILPV